MFLKIGQSAQHAFDQPLGLLSDCHRRIEHFLAVLVAITNEANGGDLTLSQREQLEGAAAYFATAAPRHTADEEETLFPRLRATNDPGTKEALDVLERLERDHSVAAEHHEVVDRLVRRWLSDDVLALPDVEQLRDRLQQLTALYSAHIAVEDDQLFPAAKRILSTDDIAEIGREMKARRFSKMRT